MREKTTLNIGELAEEYENLWTFLADKGYQGDETHVCLLHPTKKPQNGLLSAFDTARNKKLSSDRVLVGNFFGRLVGL